MQPVPQAVVFSTYTSAFDPGQLGRRKTTPHEFQHRSIGRPYFELVTEAAGIRIEWPHTDSGRIQDIISRAGTRRRYKVPCFRGGDREAQGEAEEEAFLYVLLDACAGVEFQDQPARIFFLWRGEETEHRPDCLLVADERKEFVECKDDSSAQSLFVLRRSEVLRELLALIGFGYRSSRASLALADHSEDQEFQASIKGLLDRTTKSAPTYGHNDEIFVDPALAICCSDMIRTIAADCNRQYLNLLGIEGFLLLVCQNLENPQRCSTSAYKSPEAVLNLALIERYRVGVSDKYEAPKEVQRLGLWKDFYKSFQRNYRARVLSNNSFKLTPLRGVD